MSAFHVIDAAQIATANCAEPAFLENSSNIGKSCAVFYVPPHSLDHLVELFQQKKGADSDSNAK